MTTDLRITELKRKRDTQMVKEEKTVRLYYTFEMDKLLLLYIKRLHYFQSKLAVITVDKLKVEDKKTSREETQGRVDKYSHRR